MKILSNKLFIKQDSVGSWQLAVFSGTIEGSGQDSMGKRLYIGQNHKDQFPNIKSQITKPKRQ